jgi:hypothetical protein
MRRRNFDSRKRRSKFYSVPLESKAKKLRMDLGFI